MVSEASSPHTYMALHTQCLLMPLVYSPASRNPPFATMAESWRQYMRNVVKAAIIAPVLALVSPVAAPDYDAGRQAY